MKYMLIISAYLVAENGEANTLGLDECYDSCQEYDPNLLNVHIVPHSHNDVAWLETFDEYYYRYVQNILDSVIDELWKNSERRFVYVETAFFHKWWQSQPEYIWNRVKHLVRQGRLQLAGGAWSMNDEATTHYQSVIDQFTLGLSKLKSIFGTCGRPRVGWQIDPFGHSREFASLLAAMGYDGLFLSRIDYQDKRRRIDNREMELVWRGDDELGKSSDIFTHILFDHYIVQARFCLDDHVQCGDGTSKTSVLSSLSQLLEFLNYTRNQANYYRTNNVLVPLGGDFMYQNAMVWYRNLDRVISEINKWSLKNNQKIKLFYSTPACYLKAVNKVGISFPSKQDDFFPYASNATAIWTGFYSSRPSLKLFEREANRYLQMFKQLQVLAGLPQSNLLVLDEFKSIMGLMQHHDSITGTQKQHVANDLVKQLDGAIAKALTIARQAFLKHLTLQFEPPLHFERCKLNESSCHISERSEQFIVSVYNPLAWDVKTVIRVPVKKGYYSVYLYDHFPIESQLIEIPQAVKDLPSRKSQATQEIVFLAHQKPVSVKIFYIRKEDYNNKMTYKVENLVKRNKVKKRSDAFKNKVFKLNKNNVLMEEFDTKTEKSYKDIMNLDLFPLKWVSKKRRFKENLKPQRSYGNSDIDNRSPIPPNMPSGSVNPYLPTFQITPHKNPQKKIHRSDSSHRTTILRLPALFPTIETPNPYSDLNFYLSKNTAKMRPKVSMKKIIKKYRTRINRLVKIVKRSPSNTLVLNRYENVENFSTSESKYFKYDDVLIRVPRFVDFSNDYDRWKRVERLFKKDEVPISKKNENFKNVDFSNQNYILKMDNQNDLSYIILEDGSKIHLSILFYYYPDFSLLTTKKIRQESGAYIFSSKVVDNVFTTHKDHIKGPIVDEIRYSTPDTVKYAIRVYKGMNFIEVDWIVGPIDIRDGVGKQYVIRYTTDLSNAEEFYTDSNGRQMMNRKLNTRPTWNVKLDDRVAGNYYPITNKIHIEGGRHKMAVLTDRSQGGSSLTEGSIEIMLHRRLLKDDGFGLDEALNETEDGQGLVVRGTHRLYLSEVDNKAHSIKEKEMVIEMHMQPVVLIADASKVSWSDWMKTTKHFSWLNKLPDGLHLLTIEPLTQDTMLLRLENYFETGDRDTTTVEVDLSTIFKTIKLLSVKEKVLSGDIDVDLTADGSNVAVNYLGAVIVQLEAKQIRTFVFKYHFIK